MEQSPHLCIYTFDVVYGYASSLIYSFIAIIFTNDYLNLLNIVSPLNIIYYV
nr:MAG TPA: hypothetical protein [Bacteriophage sp.]